MPRKMGFQEAALVPGDVMQKVLSEIEWNITLVGRYGAAKLEVP